jgi:transposase
MNERIKQLAIEAGYDMDMQQHQKFAELIVAEMLQTCEEHPAWTGRMIGNQIKEHFGVEE